MIRPDFSFEKRLWEKGLKFIGGCDEVGRGCFAGPVVAGVCVFDKNSYFQTPVLNEIGEAIYINDSKRLTNLRREKADGWIKRNCLAWGVGLGTVAEINKVGLSKATFSAFRRAVREVSEKLNTRVEYLLIDAFYIPYIRGLCMPHKTDKLKNRKTKELKKYKFCGNQLAIVYGDEMSISIAAASIIAKVYRDNLMISLSKKYKAYGWEKNKGYGTIKHCETIKKYGLTRHHRKQFVQTFLNNSFSSQVRSET